MIVFFDGPNYASGVHEGRRGLLKYAAIHVDLIYLANTEVYIYVLCAVSNEMEVFHLLM